MSLSDIEDMSSLILMMDSFSNFLLSSRSLCIWLCSIFLILCARSLIFSWLFFMTLFFLCIYLSFLLSSFNSFLWFASVSTPTSFSMSFYGVLILDTSSSLCSVSIFLMETTGGGSYLISEKCDLFLLRFLLYSYAYFLNFSRTAASFLCC